MISLKRNRKPFFHCKKLPDTFFDKPIYKELHYEPISSAGERISLGIDYLKYLKIKCTAKDARDFKLGDMLYIYVTPPKIHDKLCDDADYYVSADPLIKINEGEIMLKKASGGLEENTSTFIS